MKVIIITLLNIGLSLQLSIANEEITERSDRYIVRTASHVMLDASTVRQFPEAMDVVFADLAKRNSSKVCNPRNFDGMIESIDIQIHNVTAKRTSGKTFESYSVEITCSYDKIFINNAITNIVSLCVGSATYHQSICRALFRTVGTPAVLPLIEKADKNNKNEYRTVAALRMMNKDILHPFLNNLKDLSERYQSKGWHPYYIDSLIKDLEDGTIL